MVRKYSVHQRGTGRKLNYAKYQRGGLWLKKRTRRNQRGSGFFSGLAKIGKKLIKSKVAKQVLKDVVMPMAMDPMAKRRI